MPDTQIAVALAKAADNAITVKDKGLFVPKAEAKAEVPPGRDIAQTGNKLELTDSEAVLRTGLGGHLAFRELHIDAHEHVPFPVGFKCWLVATSADIHVVPQKHVSLYVTPASTSGGCKVSVGGQHSKAGASGHGMLVCISEDRWIVFGNNISAL